VVLDGRCGLSTFHSYISSEEVGVRAPDDLVL
jgi:hypothetical protein